MTDDATTSNVPPGGQPQAPNDMLPGDTEDYSAWVERLEPIARQRVGWMHDRITELTDRLRAAETERDAETRRAVFADQTASGTIADVQEQALDVVKRLELERDQAKARAAHFESLATDQQATNAAMVASLQRGLAQLQASEAEVARLRGDCAALLKILDATYDGPLGRFTRDRISEEINAALDATPRHPELIRQAQRLPRSRASLDELRRTGQSQLGRPPAGEGYPMKTCGHPEMADRQLIAPTTFRAVCWCGRNYACPTCGFGAFTLSHECAPPAPADQARREGEGERDAGHEGQKRRLMTHEDEADYWRSDEAMKHD